MEVKKNTILIVDDESDNLKILTHILSGDYEIYTAKNGKKAVEKAIANHDKKILKMSNNSNMMMCVI